MTEIWKPIAGYDGVYDVSNLGRVRSWKNGKWGRLDEPKVLKPGTNSNGYMGVGLRRDGVQTTKKVHRLVLAAFVGESDLDVNHINGIKADNHLENLEYCTTSENLIHARDVLGGVGTQVLSRTQAEEVIGLLAEGKLAQREIAADYGVVRVTISDIWTGARWSDLPRPWPANLGYRLWRKMLRSA